MSVKQTLAPFAAILAITGGLGLASLTEVRAAGAKEGGAAVHHVERQPWSFGGIFGQYDKAQLRRGFQIYNEICSACHSMNLVSYRNLTEPGGPEFTKEEVKAIIADKETPAGPNDEGATHDDEGSLLMRKPLLTDRFVSPYPNDKAAMSANGGALPPDLSVMAKARGIPHPPSTAAPSSWYMAPFAGLKEYFGWVFGTARDIATQYQEAGPDYIYALLTSYAEEAPAGVDIGDKSYNHIFPGNAISMAAPLADESVEYADGTKPTLDQHARDISAFLMWTAEPHLNARKNLGLKVMIYLIILSLLMYAVKRAVWSGVKH